ncbi:hypothetical protein CHLRE_11g477900v5 [Chlamydomonas reinhardtii]|uniref:Uncharacterized protein n=1 Tax=Chlamydomonas reinhardtii TaxID=3055 RepID=A0A2K3D8H3_CHLRE|nr:uncharacterized protein CHLRE_11g477900v5 [Chlamydomonas reinhardtii]PNW76825.1 hypothetical protein CHLRE_11g477900v5 [Chlamydomonas reinhardtii]
MVERCDIRAPIVLPGFRPEVVAILLNWLAVNRLTRRPEGASSASPCRHARGPASPCEGLAEQEPVCGPATAGATLDAPSAESEADCDSEPLSALSNASTLYDDNRGGSRRNSTSSRSSSLASSDSALSGINVVTGSLPSSLRGANTTLRGGNCAPTSLSLGLDGCDLGIHCNADAAAAEAPAAAPQPVQRFPAFQLPPLVPPQLQSELDVLIDFLGLTAAVYGTRLPHLSYGTPLPYLLATYGTRPLLSYRSSPAALVLDGSCLQLHTRGYAHASALLEPVAAAAQASAGGVRSAFAGSSKLLWKLRVSRHGSSSGGSGGCGSSCRADTSLGVLVVHVAGEPEAVAGAGAGSGGSSSGGVPVISAATAAAWAGPLPLLAAGLSSTGGAGGLGGGFSSHRRACSTLHAPGFYGWHMAGLARSHEPGAGGGAGGAAASGGGVEGGGGRLTKVQQAAAACSPSAAAGTSSGASSGPAEVRAANPLGGSHGRGALGLSSSSSSSSSSSGGGCSRAALPGMFFEEGDVLVFALDMEARRLEMQHGRLGQTYSVALPPPPAAAAVGRSGAAAAAGVARNGDGSVGGARAGQPGVRELVYAHVCLYDQGEGVEVLEVGVEDLQRMGCV